jgi:nuclear pore complex protein Nup214
MADVREVESELGGLVYQSLGTVGFSHPEEAADFPVPPGYAKLVAVSSRYGLTVFADHVGLCVAHTARLAEVCESLKEKLPAEQIVPGDDFARVPLRGASHVSFSPDHKTLAAVAGCAVHFFQTKDLATFASETKGPKAFRTQVLGDEDEAVRDLQWLAEFTDGASYLALVAKEEDVEGENAKLVVGSAMTLDQTAPVAIAEGVRAFAVARGPDDDDVDAADASATATSSGALAAWAPFGGGAVVARLTDAGYSAEMTHHSVGPCEEGAVDVVVNGLAFLVGDEKTSRRATLLALCTDREDPESHRALVLSVDEKGGESAAAFELSGAFAIDDDETAGLVGPYAHARRVREWNVALASHRKAWDNQLCAVRLPVSSPDGSIAPPCVLDVEDDRCVPSIPLAGEDEDSNFVVGLALDTTGCGGRMTHPADKSRPKLPQGPLVLVATADARLTCMRLGNLSEDAGVRFEAARVRPPRAEIPASPALAGSPAPSPPGSAAKTKLFASPEKAEDAPSSVVPAGSTPPPPTSGFGAAFLAKANAGYAKAQKALEEELEASAKPAAPSFPAAPAPGSAPTFNFGFGGDKGSTATATATTSPYALRYRSRVEVSPRRRNARRRARL